MTLQEAKDYLKIDFTDDDMYIQTLVDTTQTYIDKCCGEAYKTEDKLVKLATLVQYKLVNDLYDNRGFIDNVKNDRVVDTIFMTLSNYTETVV